MFAQLKNAVKKYENFSLDCSLEIRKGYVTGLIGQNGAGKSTAFKALLGLINLDGGEALVFGKPSSELSEADKAEIGVVFADSGFSTYLNLKSIAKIQKNLYQNFDDAAFLAKCKAANLPLDQKIKEFSRGMRAKVKLFCALSHNAKFLILDEPTSGLDVIARDEIIDIMREYMETGDRSILISSHIASDLESICDDLYMIHNGGVILHEDTDRLLGEYGLIKISDEAFESVDKKYILSYKKETYGYSLLTNNRDYYKTNYPSLVIDNGGIDHVISLMIKGETL